MGEVCDYGEFRNLIVSPQLVTSKSNRTMRHPKRRVIGNELKKISVFIGNLSIRGHPLMMS